MNFVIRPCFLDLRYIYIYAFLGPGSLVCEMAILKGSLLVSCFASAGLGAAKDGLEILTALLTLLGGEEPCQLNYMPNPPTPPRVLLDRLQ